MQSSITQPGKHLIKATVDDKTVAVNVSVKVDRTQYEQFRRMFDEQSSTEFVNFCINSGHLGEVLGDNPDLMADFLKLQNERIHGKSQED